MNGQGVFRRKSLDSLIAATEKRGLPRTLGALGLTFLGIGAIIGTGIFVLTAEAAQKAGPAMMVSLIIAGFVCAVGALCYAELSAMVPVSGSAYTYTYAVLGEVFAWMVGWALILEYLVSSSAVAVGWSGYIVGLLNYGLGIEIPFALANGPTAGGIVNLPAFAIILLITGLLILGTRESTRIIAVLVIVKIAALMLFIFLTVPEIKLTNFAPFAPLGTTGVFTAAGSIFFAFVGFDAVSTASEETRNPQRNMPIGILASLGITTVIYVLVAAGVIGSIGAQPLLDANGSALPAGSVELRQHCTIFGSDLQTPIVCSQEALAHVLRVLGHPLAGNILALAAGFALPSVILTMLYGQTRIFFTMARDGLLPASFASVHSRFGTPHVVTLLTGLIAAIVSALLPVGKLADIANSGTLFAFFMVSIAVMILRRIEPDRKRPFRTPFIWIVGPLAAVGCLVLFFSLSFAAKLLFPIWAVIGLVFYRSYGYRRSTTSGRAQ